MKLAVVFSKVARSARGAHRARMTLSTVTAISYVGARYGPFECNVLFYL